MMPNILLIEVKPSRRLMVKDSLESRGLTVECAANGEAGLQLLRQQYSNIVVSDVMMPKQKLHFGSHEEAFTKRKYKLIK
ncbi:hypothetical protein [Hymenobacter sp. B1770]|uniref:hypothetical protein n=1 Tax=Hymenobacter sp. B1770 TaxID=1718788 RepID=UPI003CF26E50